MCLVLITSEQLSEVTSPWVQTSEAIIVVGHFTQRNVYLVSSKEHKWYPYISHDIDADFAIGTFTARASFMPRIPPKSSSRVRDFCQNWNDFTKI